MMRMSHQTEEKHLLTDIRYRDWRFSHSREKAHRESVYKALRRRPRFRLNGAEHQS